MPVPVVCFPCKNQIKDLLRAITDGIEGSEISDWGGCGHGVVMVPGWVLEWYSKQWGREGRGGY